VQHRKNVHDAARLRPRRLVTFQAPVFYARNGYVEFARTESVPAAGSADVHTVKVLRAVDRSPRPD
jgi:hypothetical protein